jgi:hypothetical protein
MDNYIEHIVETRQSMGAIFARSVGTALMVVGVFAALFFNLIIIGLLPFILGLVISLIAKSRTNYEFEYEITNGDFSIDKILNKSSRKHIIDFSEDQIKRIMLYDNPKFQNELDLGKISVKNFTSGDKGKHEGWYGMIVDKGKNQFAVIVETDDRTKEYIEQYFKKKLEK